MPNELIDILERLAVGSVAVTGRAIAAAGADLSFVQWRVLLIVGEREDGATVGEIAARIGAHVSPASRLVSRLKRRGVVRTAKDDSDGRVTRVRLTESGLDLRGRVLEQRRRDLALVLAAASLTAIDVAAVAKVARAFESFA
ncbi:MAG TPA: MarR family transcriptional regulator [Candidatus Limnocylindrales bacterium]|jgi:DNA-binding MarR family transcriptional regulator